jgi:hypothetical protein
MAGKLKWWEAAEILGITDRQLRRIRERYAEWGNGGRRMLLPSMTCQQSTRVPVCCLCAANRTGATDLQKRQSQ